MAEQEAQYDHIGSKYDEYAQTATMKRAESYTVLQMVGPLAGQRVLDLACGFGFYTRLLKIALERSEKAFSFCCIPQSLKYCFKQFGTPHPLPALLTIGIATLSIMDYSAHSYLLPKLMPCEKWMAKDGEIAPWLQSLSVSRQVFSRASSRRDGRCGDRGQRILDLKGVTACLIVQW